MQFESLQTDLTVKQRYPDGTFIPLGTTVTTAGIIMVLGVCESAPAPLDQVTRLDVELITLLKEFSLLLMDPFWVMVGKE